MGSKVEAKTIEYSKSQEKQVFTKEFFYLFKYLSSIYHVTASVSGLGIHQWILKCIKISIIMKIIFSWEDIQNNKYNKF